jgi:hypothetical protein
MSGSASGAIATVDARMTAGRHESKYLLSAAGSKLISDALNAHLAPHRFRGAGANALPHAHHFITTIYFDSASRALFHAARASDTHLKLRAREYYDLHPHLAETSTDAGQLVRYRPEVFLEIKHRTRERTGKRRIAIPKGDVPGFFGAGRITPAMIALQEAAYGAEAAAVLAEVAALCAHCAEPLVADCLVNYRRAAWQDTAGDLRVTLDRGLAYFAPPADLWTRATALVRDSLGAPRAAEPGRVLEIKRHGPLPTWLTAALTAVAAEPVAFSKFEAAARAIHG